MLQSHNTRPRFPKISDQHNTEVGSIYEELIKMAGHPNRDGYIEVLNTTMGGITSNYVPEIRQYMRKLNNLIEFYVGKE